ncbi:MAG: hypothetical protein ACXWXN_03775 [Actinomycetota bacterium]
MSIPCPVLGRTAFLSKEPGAFPVGAPVRSGPMLRYLVRRALFMVLVLFIVSLLTFLIS